MRMFKVLVVCNGCGVAYMPGGAGAWHMEFKLHHIWGVGVLPVGECVEVSSHCQVACA